MDKEAYFTNKFSYFLGLVALLASFYIFFRETGQMGGSMVAATMTAVLVWVTYLMLRWLLLANKR